MCDFFTVVIAVALFPKESFYLLHAVLTRGVEFEEFTHHRGLVLVNYQPSPIFDVAKNAAVPQHHIFLDSLGMAKFDTTGQLTKFILCDAGHDG